MFVTLKEGRLRLVTQQDHALQCGDLLEAWANSRFARPEPFESVLTAVRRHDDGWIEPDALPLLNSGTGRPQGVLDVDLREHARFYERGVEQAAAADPYAGLLVSMHWTGLYRGRWGLGPAFDPERSRAAGLDDVVEGQERRWIALREELRGKRPGLRRGAFEHELWSNYDLLQAIDLLSIFLCTRFAGETERLPFVPVGEGMAATDIELVALDDERVRVTPFPFRDDALEVTVRSWDIEDRRYDDAASIRAAMDERGPVPLRRTLVG